MCSVATGSINPVSCISAPSSEGEIIIFCQQEIILIKHAALSAVVRWSDDHAIATTYITNKLGLQLGQANVFWEKIAQQRVYYAGPDGWQKKLIAIFTSNPDNI